MPDKALVIIPSYNTGPVLVKTVESALQYWKDVWLVIDGSDDGSDLDVQPLLARNPGLKLLRLETNQGKGAAVRHAAEAAKEAGFSSALVMDADGQHPADHIPALMERSAENPGCLVMGQPVFGPEVPRARLYGRRLTIFWTEIESLWVGLGDTLFGMRVYPLAPLCRVFSETGFARGYDFDPEVAVRLVWSGVRPVQIDVPVRYFTESEGGVSHFNYLRDNAKLTLLHFRLMPLFFVRGFWQTMRAKRSWGA